MSACRIAVGSEVFVVVEEIFLVDILVEEFPEGVDQFFHGQRLLVEEVGRAVEFVPLLG